MAAAGPAQDGGVPGHNDGKPARGDLAREIERYLNRPGWRLLATEVLVVEDDPFNMKLLRDLLALLGHAVIAADSGGDVVTLARRFRPALILIGDGVRGGAGLDLGPRLRADAALAAIPVIALVERPMSGTDDPIDLAGYHGVVTMPLSFHRFVRLLETALPTGPD